jgi:hypothetical protein
MTVENDRAASSVATVALSTQRTAATASPTAAVSASWSGYAPGRGRRCQSRLPWAVIHRRIGMACDYKAKG